MKPGDRVVTPDGKGKVFVVGKFIGVELPKRNKPREFKKRYYYENEIVTIILAK